VAAAGCGGGGAATRVSSVDQVQRAFAAQHETLVRRPGPDLKDKGTFVINPRHAPLPIAMLSASSVRRVEYMVFVYESVAKSRAADRPPDRSQPILRNLEQVRAANVIVLYRRGKPRLAHVRAALAELEAPD
jgi:hypothetical protein